MKPLLIALVIFIFFFSYCMKEYSCEGCGSSPVAVEDTIFIPYEIHIGENWRLSHIEPQIKTRLQPDYSSFEIINSSGDSSHTYKGEYILNDYFDLTLLNKGDSIDFRFMFVFLDGTFDFLDYATYIKK